MENSKYHANYKWENEYVHFNLVSEGTLQHWDRTNEASFSSLI